MTNLQEQILTALKDSPPLTARQIAMKLNTEPGSEGGTVRRIGSEVSKLVAEGKVESIPIAFGYQLSTD